MDIYNWRAIYSKHGLEGWNIGPNLSNTKPQHLGVGHFSQDPNNSSSHLIISMYDSLCTSQIFGGARKS